MNKNPKKSPIVPLSFQLLTMIITALIVSMCCYQSFKTFTSSEKVAEVMKVTPQLMTQFGGSANTVTVGLTIDDYLAFDPIKDNFTFIGSVWFEFDPTYATLDTLGKFQISRAEIKEKSEPDTRIVNGRFLARYTVKVNFKNQLSYVYFPFDDHRVFVQLTNPLLSIGDITFQSVVSDFVVNAKTNILGWTLAHTRVDTGYSSEGVQEGQVSSYYPVALFSMDYSRTGTRYELTILLPLLAIFFISLFVFSLDPLSSGTLAVSLSAGSVTALLAYRFVIENLSPAVGYFMVSDFIFFLTLALASFVFICSIVLKHFPLWAKYLLVTAFHMIVCIAFFYVSFVWMG